MALARRAAGTSSSADGSGGISVEISPVGAYAVAGATKGAGGCNDALGATNAADCCDGSLDGPAPALIFGPRAALAPEGGRDLVLLAPLPLLVASLLPMPTLRLVLAVGGTAALLPGFRVGWLSAPVAPRGGAGRTGSVGGGGRRRGSIGGGDGMGGASCGSAPFMNVRSGLLCDAR